MSRKSGNRFCEKDMRNKGLRKKMAARKGPRRDKKPAGSALTRAAAEPAATTTAAPEATAARTRAARTTRPAGPSAGPAHHGLRLAGEQALALRALAGELARPADRFRLLTRLLFGGFFIMAAKLHFAENSLALHLLLERLEGLVDVVVADENLQAKVPSGS